jgi:hypothetical protein
MTHSMLKGVDAHEQKLPLPASSESQDTTRQWAEANATSIDQYNAWALQREPYSQRVRHWREKGV